MPVFAEKMHPADLKKEKVITLEVTTEKSEATVPSSNNENMGALPIAYVDNHNENRNLTLDLETLQNRLQTCMLHSILFV